METIFNQSLANYITLSNKFLGTNSYYMYSKSTYSVTISSSEPILSFSLANSVSKPLTSPVDKVSQNTCILHEMRAQNKFVCQLMHVCYDIRHVNAKHTDVYHNVCRGVWFAGDASDYLSCGRSGCRSGRPLRHQLCVTTAISDVSALFPRLLL